MTKITKHHSLQSEEKKKPIEFEVHANSKHRTNSSLPIPQYFDYIDVLGKDAFGKDIFVCWDDGDSVKRIYFGKLNDGVV